MKIADILIPESMTSSDSLRVDQVAKKVVKNSIGKWNISSSIGFPGSCKYNKMDFGVDAEKNIQGQYGEVDEDNDIEVTSPTDIYSMALVNGGDIS